MNTSGCPPKIETILSHNRYSWKEMDSGPKTHNNLASLPLKFVKKTPLKLTILRVKPGKIEVVPTKPLSSNGPAISLLPWNS